LAGLAEVEAQLGERKARVVGISVDEASDSKALRTRLGLGFPLLSDPGARVARAYGVAMADQELAIPAVFIIDQRRTLVWSHVGETVPDRPTPDAVLDALDRVVTP
jgi:peroxiredoxin